MTDREKQIEEMARLLCHFENNLETYQNCTDCQEYVGKASKGYVCPFISKSERLYENGYRKIIPNVDFVVRASDLVKIREKAIRDVLQELFDMVREQGKHPITTPVNWVENVNALAKKYGVKVD